MLAKKNKSQDKIATHLGVSQSTISRVSKNNEEAIQIEAEKIIAALPDITTQLVKEISLSADVLAVLQGEKGLEELSEPLQTEKIFTKFMELTYKNRVDVLKAVGIYPANTQNSFIQNIFEKGSQSIISPIVMDVIGKHVQESMEED